MTAIAGHQSDWGCDKRGWLDSGALDVPLPLLINYQNTEFKHTHETGRLTLGLTIFTTKSTKLAKNAQRLFSQFASLSFNYKSTIINHRVTELTETRN